MSRDYGRRLDARQRGVGRSEKGSGNTEARSSRRRTEARNDAAQSIPPHRPSAGHQNEPFKIRAPSYFFSVRLRVLRASVVNEPIQQDSHRCLSASFASLRLNFLIPTL